MAKDEYTDTESEEKKEDSGGSGKSKALIPEDFQEEVHELVEGCENEQQLDYIRSCCSKKQTDMHKADTAKEKGKNPKTMGEFSSADMPS